MRSIELFTGTGGLALGVANAGFAHDLLIDRDSHACATLRENTRRVPEMRAWNITEGDVADIDYRPHAGFIDLLAAGAPCQPFSLGGRHGGQDDTRNMFPEVLRAVRELEPAAILIENVKGLLRPSFSSYFEYILLQMADPTTLRERQENWDTHKVRLSRRSGGKGLRYNVSAHLLNTADFGVPQRRERVFIVAFRSDLDASWEPPQPTHGRDALLYAQHVDGSYWREHELEPRPIPERFRRTIARLTTVERPSVWRWRTVRDALRGLPPPADYSDDPVFPNHVGNPGARSYPGHTGSPWDEPAKTLKAGVHGVPGGENMLRTDDGDVRYFTVREAGRLQTFPDAYRFSGPWSERMRQLGNAVPVLMAEVLAGRIREHLESAYASDSTPQTSARGRAVHPSGNYRLLSPKGRYEVPA